MGDIKAAQPVRIYDPETDTQVAVAVRDVAAGSADGGIASMAVRVDVGATLAGTDGDYSPLQVDSIGRLRVTIAGGGNASVFVDDTAFAIATDSVTVLGGIRNDAADAVDDGDAGALRMTSDRKLLVRVVGSADAKRMEVTAAGAVHTNFAQVLGATHSELNPIFVKVVDTVVSAVEIHDYNTIASLAPDATDDHDVAAAGTTFLLKRVLVAASGAGKWEIQTGPVASLLTKAVLFTTASHPTDRAVFDPPIEITGTTPTVRVIRRNDDNQAQDMYSTIMGNDV